MRNVLLWACALALPIGISAASAGELPAPTAPSSIIPVEDGRYYDSYSRESDWQYRNQRNYGSQEDSLQQRGLNALDEFLGGGEPDVVPPEEIVRDLEREDYDNVSRPLLNDDVYLVRAIDPYGRDVDLYIDAYDGRIIDRDYRG